MRRKRPVPLRSPLSVLPNSNVARRKGSHAANGGPWRRNMPKLKKRAESRGAKLTGHQPGGQQRFEFGSEYQLAAGLAQVKRLDAQAVAPENQFAVAVIPDCEGKHPAELFHESL